MYKKKLEADPWGGKDGHKPFSPFFVKPPTSNVYLMLNIEKDKVLDRLSQISSNLLVLMTFVLFLSLVPVSTCLASFYLTSSEPVRLDIAHHYLLFDTRRRPTPNPSDTLTLLVIVTMPGTALFSVPQSFKDRRSIDTHDIISVSKNLAACLLLLFI